MGVWLSLLLLIGVAILVLVGGDADQIAGFDLRDVVLVATGVAMLIFVGSSITGTYRGRLTQAARDITAWGGLILVFVVGYSYRDELRNVVHRVSSEVTAPGTAARVDAQVDGERAVRIRRRPEGHFVARAEVNGTAMTMLVDTGASTVVLKPNDATRLGIDIDKLRYTVPVQTANGTTYAASVRLKTLAVGPIAFREVDALVSKPGALKDSLLGMTFLNRLRSYEFSGDYLTLRI
jgi:aspartyl protease family protein